MIKLFYSIGNPLPSETTCRRRINDLADEELERIKSLLAGDVLMVIDESELRGLRYLNVLVISMGHSQVAYLIFCNSNSGFSDSKNTIIHAIDDTMRKLATEQHKQLPFTFI